VSEPTYGIIVEGPYDVPVYEELIPKISPAIGRIISRPAGGVTKLLRLLPSLLRDLEHVKRGEPVDKVLVIRDASGKSTPELDRQFSERIRTQAFSFPKGIKFHAVHRAVETWLLVDVSAINAVALARGGRPVSDITGDVETIEDPKGKLRNTLSCARLPYDPMVCGEIARRIRLETLRYRSPSFRAFEEKVLDC
jgi:hypothetical protein